MQSIIKEIKVGEVQAAIELCNSILTLVRKNCEYRLKERCNQEELIRVCLLKILEKLPKQEFDSEAGFKAWCRSIAQKTCQGYINRTKKLEHDVEYYLSDRTVPETASSAFALKDIYASIDELPPKLREVLVMNVLEQLRHGEIGRRLGIKTSTSRSFLSQARKLLEPKLIKIGFYVPKRRR